MIEQYGGGAIRCPTLRIAEPHDWTPALAIFDRLADYHLAIFTSVNAVGRALPLIQERNGFPSSLEIAAIGQATARALKRQGVAHCLHPTQGFTSEALLALPRFQNITGQRIIIVRGEGGREWLAETLTGQGAQVDCAEVYRRERSSVDTGALLERWACGEIGAVVITSIESLQNLFAMLGTAGQPYLRDTPLVVVSARIRHSAVEQGCHHLLLACEASDEAIIAALFDLTTHSSTPVR
ncbi:MAG TPA: uroporphyrinogen-III synthase [Candidatus Competibacteraceae bacterium]|nr:uroporphyrinogen-III synthase [Candidatus Competibacteraceae bacterium]HRZ07903.1 uroporphyrinogen-III synthase [Candidatus Competibacteraceae bacterium]